MTDEVETNMSSETAEVLSFLTRFPTEEIPRSVLHESKRCLLDFLGVAIGASGELAPTIVSRQMSQLGGHPQATVFGTEHRLRVTDAALVNGIAAHVFDFDDTHLQTMLHASAPVYAAALAVAEWRDRPGVELLAAHAMGYEFGARASLAMYPGHLDAGWHTTGTTGTLAAAGAVGRLLNFPVQTSAHCLGLAATQAAGHREQFGSMTKSFHAGHSAEGGVMAAILAEGGFTAAPDSLQGRRGMFRIMSATSTPSALSAGLGDRWEIFNNGIKPYACGVVIHPAIDAVLKLRNGHAIDSESVESIELTVHPFVVDVTGILRPKTALEGKFSLVFACAIALIDGAARERQFSDVNVARPDVRELMSRIVVRSSETLPRETVTAKVVLRGGREKSVTVEAATGTPSNRISDDELLGKFHDLVDPNLGSSKADCLAEQVWSLDGALRVDELVAASLPTPTG